jgi:hypothetical protein
MSAMKNSFHSRVIEQAAYEAAQSARDAHGVGNEPAARISYEFIRELWLECDEPLAYHLPTEAPVQFVTAYYACLEAR